MKIRIKIQGALVFLGLGAFIFFYKLMMPHYDSMALNSLMSFLGICLVLFGFLFRISARGYKEEKSSNGNALVKDGPYAIIRNPMYFGTFMIGTGVIMMLLKPWFILLFTAIFLLIYIPQMRKEERELLARFGHEYNEYCKATHKYIPNINYLFRINKYVSLKPFWIKKEIVPFISTVVVIALLKMLEHPYFSTLK